MNQVTLSPSTPILKFFTGAILVILEAPGIDERNKLFLTLSTGIKLKLLQVWGNNEPHLAKLFRRLTAKALVCINLFDAKDLFEDYIDVLGSLSHDLL